MRRLLESEGLSSPRASITQEQNPVELLALIATCTLGACAGDPKGNLTCLHQDHDLPETIEHWRPKGRLFVRRLLG
jgi:hypothetical protein